jgi:hypothetical protein
MKFLALVKSSEKYRTAGPPQALMEAMGRYVQESFASGRVIDTGGLKPSSAAIRVRIEQGKLTVTDGPFTEAKEVIGGWAILKVSSRAEALENCKAFMDLHRQYWPEWEGMSEVFEMEEYG